MGLAQPKENKANSFLKAVQKVKGSGRKPAKKKEMPSIDAPATIRNKVDAYVQAKKKFNAAKAEMDHNGGAIIEFVRKTQDTEGLKGNFHGSYQVLGYEELVKFVSANKYSINTDDQEELQEILQENYDDLVEEHWQTGLRPEVYTDPELQERLMDLLGNEFELFMESKLSLKPRENFAQKLYALGVDVVESVRVFVKQAKPSLR